MNHFVAWATYSLRTFIRRGFTEVFFIFLAYGVKTPPRRKGEHQQRQESKKGMDTSAHISPAQ